MNMISTGSFQAETSASNKKSELLKTLTAAWEKKNSNAARAGGVSLMALTLAACGSSEDTTAFSQADVDAAKAEGEAAGAAAEAAAMIDAINEALGTSLTGDEDAAAIIATIAASNDADIAAEATEAAEAAAATAAEAAAATAAEALAASQAETLAAQTAAADAATAAAAELATLQAAYDALVAPVSSSLTDSAVTGSVDVVTMSSGNDVVTGTSATIDSGDIIVDGSTADSDTLNLTAVAFANSMTTAGATITNVENINVAFDSLVQSTFVASGINTASTITVSQARAGGSDNIVVQNVASGTTVVAGSGVNTLTLNTMTAGNSAIVDGGSATGTITADVSGAGTLTVTANSAATVDVSSATGAITATAAGATTIDVEATTGLATVTGGSATSAVDVDSAGDQVVDATLSKNAHAVSTGLTSTVTLTAEGNAVDIRGKTMTLNLVESDTTDATVVADGVGVADVLTINGGGDNVSVTNGGTNTVETIVSNMSAAKTVTITNAAASTYTADANTTFAGASGMFTTATVTGGTLDITDVTAAVDLTNVTSNVTISDDDITAGRTITLGADGMNVTISGELDEDLTLAVSDGTSTNVSYGVNITLTEDIDNADGGTGVAEITLTGAAGADAITTANIDIDVAQTDLLLDAADTAVTLTGSVAAVLDVSGTAIDVASLDASQYSGAITATIGAITASTGSGADVITAGSTSALSIINTGAGNDTINTAAALTGTVNGGDGTDTLNVTGAVDLSGATISGIEILDINANAVTVDEALLNGNAVVVDGTAALTVNNILQSLDLGNVTFSSTASTVINFGNRDASLGAGADFTVTGTGAVDVITTGNGTNVVTAGAGADEVTGGTGVDTIIGGDGADGISGGAGADAINGDAGADIIAGGAGADTINGGAGADYIFGGADADTIDGGAAADYIGGGAGADILTGGAGADIYIYETQGASAVAEATAGAAGTKEVQTVTLSGQFFAGETVTVTAASSATLSYVVQAGDALADVAAGLAAATGSAGWEYDLSSSGAVLTLTESAVGGADLAASTVAISTSLSSTDASVSISAANVVQGFDTITDWSYTEDSIDYASSTGTTAVAGASGVAGTTATSNVEVSAGGKVTFAAADDTLVEKLTAIAADDTDIADGEVAFFEHGSDTYIYLANDTDVGTTDAMIMLQGVTGFTALSVTADVITIA